VNIVLMAMRIFWSVNRPHVFVPVPELYEDIACDLDVSSYELMKLFNRTEIGRDSLILWANYNNGLLYDNKLQLSTPLKTIVDFCEGSHLATKGLKEKLRLVTKIMIENNDVDRANIFILLAAHGGVCNIQKEVGVSMAYSLLTDSVQENVERISLKSFVLRILYSLRELIVEEVFMSTGPLLKNTHPLIHFRNALANEVGISRIEDDSPYSSHFNPEHIQVFWERYNLNMIINTISNAINSKPRKIPYENVVNWLMENRILEETDPIEFLEHCFDEETGFLKDEAIKFILHRFEIIWNANDVVDGFSIPSISNRVNEIINDFVVVEAPKKEKR